MDDGVGFDDDVAASEYRDVVGADFPDVAQLAEVMSQMPVAAVRPARTGAPRALR